MKKLLLIDGNSIMNRAFYGIMSSKNLTTDDGKNTNALYGFLSILFKNLEEVKPDYILIAFDSKTAANVRKKMYDGYKKNRHGMPDELAEQMPEIKEILKAMNIQYLEMADYEGDDILGSAAKQFASNDLEAYILSGDKDLFQLVQENIYVRIPRTKMGKTETITYDASKVKEEFGLDPKDLIDLKALMGDSSDEIPGCPGVGPKTATTLLQDYMNLDNLYKVAESEECDIREKLRQKLIENKELVYLSKDLGTINIHAELPYSLDELELKEWSKDEVAKLFVYYKFNRFIERFGLENVSDDGIIDEDISEKIQVVYKKIQDVEIKEKLIYYLVTNSVTDDNRIIKKDIEGIGIYEESTQKIVYCEKPDLEDLKSIFESEEIEKISFNLSEDYVILRENGIKTKNIKYDVEVAAYDLDPSNVKHNLRDVALEYLKFDIMKYVPDTQMNLFEESSENKEIGAYVYAIKKLYDITFEKLKENESLKLFEEIEMPLVTALGEMQYNGMLCDKGELVSFGEELKKELEVITKKIYDLAGEEFNINSTQQLGTILFEKLKLTIIKKNKKGYSTDVKTLEKIKDEHPIVEEILKYRGLTKLNSTYVEGLIPYINSKTGRIHSYFHQTITATGRISSTDPNLQNIPSRDDFGKQIKKAFKPAEGYVYVDADYSQIELRVLAHVSGDKKMITAFNNDEDIHRDVAARVFGIKKEEVSKEQRTKAKAVNFGIVYGITAFGLAEQLGISRTEANEYIESYKRKYSGINKFMNEIADKARETGYVETIFGRRRYIPELKSSNYMIREFGKRAAMNTPIQGTAADIMKIATNNVYRELEKRNIDAKIILQVHDELIIEAKKEVAEEVKQILVECMQNAVKLDVPLKVELCEANNWYDAK